ncbi:phytanoyl-CoA dioxygenase family protein [Novosphingobium malaysiense]|uniref:Phytanoyl-CoA dioxygenase n=1 Tax=Novosphingobium malaysiense TaxID=1348853 RepID=A0A0B1ZM22_9SPHN|nr:phytanoyl-CoA dioxygenase family protein [Novosphingobium malaysiense]KHK90335.1 hypothetical protein LK12_17140 [Novosphingobium malaysiense]
MNDQPHMSDEKVRPADCMRDVTDAEIGHFFEHGWAMLRGLLDPEFAAELLAAAKRLMGVDATSHTAREGIDHSNAWNAYSKPHLDDPGFAYLTRHSALGRNAAKLLGRDSEIYLATNTIAVKLAGDSPLNKPTPFHQDAVGPIDRMGLNFWIALDEVKPEQGPLQFMNGSHRLGPIGGGAYFGADVSPGTWSNQKRCTISEIPHLMPGDATVHGNFTLHRATENKGNAPRWAYFHAVTPGDAKYTGFIASDRITGPFDTSTATLMYRPD